MITALIILAFAEILFRIFDAEMDTIAHRPKECWFCNWRWYVDNNWQVKSWWLKVPLSMFLDGWHFIKFLAQISRISGGVNVLCFAYSLSWYYGIPLVIVLYGFGGIIFEMFYGNKFL